MSWLWRLLYSLAWYLALPLAFAYLWRRGARQPEYRRDWPERLGFYRQTVTGPVIWLHAVSVGETRAAQVLVNALRQRHPDHRIVLTQMTPTGRDTARQLFGDSVTVAYLPYDLPGAVGRFLRHFRPRFGVLMEMELWPNLLHGSADAGVPLYLVNARLSEKSLRGYQRVSGLVGPALARLAGVAAQGPRDAERLTSLGAKAVQVSGNIKFDFGLDSGLTELGLQWRQHMGERPVWAAACTREGEEALLLDALARQPLPEEVLLVLVPRHPQRFDEVANLLAQRGLRYLRRSQWQGDAAVPAQVQVLLGDSLGELAAYYAAVDLAFVGGSLVDLGSHSVIEPCAQGVPVLLGPSSFNFADAVAEAVALGAAQQCADADAVVAGVASLLAAPAARQGMAQAGLAFVAGHRGAVARVMTLLP
ncbi:3-deoxy-D-manno-octulosonic acid transferase [Chitinimonas prasina]|uniref:3-deoxy-D-manno-octulosonic acid transferase n=1 Tax=Chitinimonas prasina TaxID=1434937 RepID=A0ABQ5YCP6_9NEIS|nr:lipid IV(A) 3-deoxy-D-manno-octulosonic acid transferase [Chitinimonas prasina]GLR12564.1 3-deoxy-D-manno-octulosonic acid transferase [Chitinimonas prasina]